MQGRTVQCPCIRSFAGNKQAKHISEWLRRNVFPSTLEWKKKLNVLMASKINDNNISKLPHRRWSFASWKIPANRGRPPRPFHRCTRNWSREKAFRMSRFQLKGPSAIWPTWNWRRGWMKREWVIRHHRPGNILWLFSACRQWIGSRLRCQLTPAGLVVASNNPKMKMSTSHASFTLLRAVFVQWRETHCEETKRSINNTVKW